MCIRDRITNCNFVISFIQHITELLELTLLNNILFSAVKPASILGICVSVTYNIRLIKQTLADIGNKMLPQSSYNPDWSQSTHGPFKETFGETFPIPYGSKKFSKAWDIMLRTNVNRIFVK